MVRGNGDDDGMTDESMPHQYRPFLVADRPASLRMIRGASLEAFPRRCGIMAHANVSDTVKEFVRDFPSSSGFYPPGTTSERKQEYEDESRYLRNPDRGELTELGQQIRADTVRICDSGVFTKDGSDFESYEELYKTYNEMDVDYGIIIDELNDPEATLVSAQDALATYETGSYGFDLVGVAQGTSRESYLQCYDDLRSMGYEHIAIGGLLESTGNRGGSFANVSNEQYMAEILERVRNEYPTDWLFALGCHHPRRRELFRKLGLFGADYKGWIYQYSAENDRGIVSARNWRYRNIRSFIRNNILTDIWLPPQSDLPVPQRGPAQLVIFPEAGIEPAPDDPVQIINHLDIPQTEIYLDAKAVRDADANWELSALVYTPSTGLVPEDFHLRPEHVSPLHKYENLQESVEIDLEKFFQYRAYDKVILVGSNRVDCELVGPLREQIELETAVHSLTGTDEELAAKLADQLHTGGYPYLT